MHINITPKITAGKAIETPQNVKAIKFIMLATIYIVFFLFLKRTKQTQIISATT